MSATQEHFEPKPLPAGLATRRPVSIRNNETLAKIALFRSLDAPAIVELDSQCVWRKYSRNDWIIEHHETSEDVFFILSGTVRLKIPAPSGRDVLFQDLQAGSYFGEVDAIDGQPRATGALSYTDTVIARMPRKVFLEAMHRYPEAGDQLMLRMAAIIRSLATRVREFSTLDVKHRIYAELLRLSQPKAGTKDRAVISPPPVQAAIAARISTRREAVAREMKALERAGLIERKRGALVLTNTRHLRCMLKRDANCEDGDFEVGLLPVHSE
ncbi:MAG: Crp/Fnr family transcriptional regulator [Pseudorhodoplanes sp.]